MQRERPPTQRDVAQRAGVSTATVSYILSGRRDRVAPVTPETRARVLRAVDDLGYQLNHVARSLRRQRTELVCLVYRLPESPWLERLTEQLQECAESHGYSAIGLPLRSGTPSGPALRVLRERLVDGAILAPGTRIPPDELTRLARRGLALMVFEDGLTPDGFDVVDQDQATACRSVVRHLHERGHRRIGYLAHDAELAPDADAVQALKYRSFVAEMTALGLGVDDRLVVAAADSRARAYTETQRLLRADEPPTALLSASDRGAVDAIWAARDLGRSVPGDLAVAGIGNTHEGETITPTLTTVGMPRLDFSPSIGRLFERVHAPAGLPGARLRQPWTLIVRDSS
ncbi:MAG: LacI family DNA-binding transcriptional regulator [Actinocatenispora sp.]